MGSGSSAKQKYKEDNARRREEEDDELTRQREEEAEAARRALEDEQERKEQERDEQISEERAKKRASRKKRSSRSSDDGEMSPDPSSPHSAVTPFGEDDQPVSDEDVQTSSANRRGSSSRGSKDVTAESGSKEVSEETNRRSSRSTKDVDSQSNSDADVRRSSTNLSRDRTISQDMQGMTSSMSMSASSNHSSSLDMDARQARRKSLHDHHLAEQQKYLEGLAAKAHTGEDEEDHHHHHHHNPRRQGSVLGGESLAILHQKIDERAHAHGREVMDSLCSFRVGDRVTPQGGPDAHGPWERLGEGVVTGRGKTKGFLNVQFGKTGDVFQMKAANLSNLTDPSRSGAHMLSSGNGFEIKKRASPLGNQDLHANAQSDPMRGLKPGDHVGLGYGGEGIVIKEGSQPGMALVRMGDLGIRQVAVKDLTKKKSTAGDLELEAQKAAEVDTDHRKRFTLSLNEVQGGFSEKHAWTEGRRAKEELAAQQEEEAELARAKVKLADDPLKGLKVGDYVIVNDSNPMWHDIGCGCIRAHGTKSGTFSVQFDSGGDTWVLYAAQLQKTQAPDRRFRKHGQVAIPETEIGKKRHQELHKNDHRHHEQREVVESPAAKEPDKSKQDKSAKKSSKKK